MIGITVNFIFHSFISPLARFKYLCSRSFFFHFHFHQVVCWHSKFHEIAGFFFLLIQIRSDLLNLNRWSSFIWKSQRIICLSFSRIDSVLCIYHLLAWWTLFVCSPRFFPSGRVLKEFEWQQVSFGLQETSAYSAQSQQCCSLNYVNSSSNFYLFQSPFPSLMTVPSTPITIDTTITCIFCSFFSLWQGPSIYLSFQFFHFYTVVHWNRKIRMISSPFFSC